ncbi:MAG TPA: hypothetical protein VKR06_10450 [Ktedonosporobacter sp.]|nr:hypothetical protein [Ktedonosporobacter sp.]
MHLVGVLLYHWAYEKREDGCHSPAAVLGEQKGAVYPEFVLNRILFATRYTRHLNRFGDLRVQGWKLYGERSLPSEPVTVWVYDGSITVAYQTVTLSKYRVELQEGRKQIKQISNPSLLSSTWPLMSGACTGRHPHISEGAEGAASQTSFNCRCLILSQSLWRLVKQAARNESVPSSLIWQKLD